MISAGWHDALSQALLHGADLTGASGLTQEQVDHALGSERTLLPEGLRHPERWLSAEGDG